MNCWVVIPIKAPEGCKTRLAPVLGDSKRRKLVAEMLRLTVSAAQAVVGQERVLLLGPSRHGLSDGIQLLPDPGHGLNQALMSARDAAAKADVSRLLILSADLPLIASDDVAAMLNLSAESVAVAPDHTGAGTNAVSLPLPSATKFSFHYGDGSFAAHRVETVRAGLPFVTLQRPGLAFDIDRPEELALWRQSGVH
ncbi:MAG TPA: 2-phospho-L-lactate guanylyltransferase [Sphingobium sp.]|nr:2-phospho-L-lactate guanylyltransferase [Sphingobium sp.]